LFLIQIFMKMTSNKTLVITYISRALIFLLCSSLFICLIYCWHSDALDWQQTEKLRTSDKSDIYLILLVVDVVTLITMIKEKVSNKFLYIKEFIETSVVILLLIAHVSGIIQTAIGLYAEAFMCTLFCLVNFGVNFISSSKRNT